MTNNRLKRGRDEDSRLADKENKRKCKIQRKEELPDVSKANGNSTYERRKTTGISSNARPNPKELCLALMPTIEKIDSRNRPNAFRKELIKIKKKLAAEQYLESWDYVEDVRLMFENFSLTNRNIPSEYDDCSKLSQKFELEIDSVMQTLGYCCGRKYKFEPQVLFCSGKPFCTIPINAYCFSYQNRRFICEKCFNESPGDSVNLNDELPSETHIKKDQFLKQQNNISTPEPFIDCSNCGRKQHQICVLYLEKNWPNGFVCDSCLATKNDVRNENSFTAKNLPKTMISTHIEVRVNDFINKNKINAAEVHIRMLSNTEEMVQVKPEMRNLFVESGEMNAEFPYRSKAIFAFQEINGVDVCFFGMQVQEYGSECPNPNARRVNIAFLDSVNFFEPKNYRTAIYHEILLGYMSYVKQLGYTMVHIWVCPPLLGQNYIFYSRPTEQKIPDSKRLRSWYRKILQKGKTERIIEDFQDIFEQAKADKLTTAAELPYFENDFWPYFLEESIKELGKKMQAKENEAEKPSNRNRGRCKRKRTSRKRNYRPRLGPRTCRPIDTLQQKIDLRSKLFAAMKRHKGLFFSVRLCSTADTLAPFQDPDSVISSNLMSGLNSFFNFSVDNNYEFSTLRRAKFSTLSILYELHNQEVRDTNTYICNSCENEVQTRYHCAVCDDYDLCVDCYEKVDHIHEMHKLDLDDNISPSDLSQAPPEDCKQSFHGVRSLSCHTCLCEESNCQKDLCQTMKNAVSHLNFCTDRGCAICSHLRPLFLDHANNCENVCCPYFFSWDYERNAQQQEQQHFHRMQPDEILRRIGLSLIKISSNILEIREPITSQNVLLNAVIDTTRVEILLQKFIQTLTVNPVNSSTQNQNAATQTN